jgi:CDP-paratose 2-epimerase
MRILVSGGAGFVGSYLSRYFKKQMPSAQVVAFDNLKRRGSELNLAQFRKEGIDFVHGDVRLLDDLMALPGEFDLFIEASAEPSVLAGTDGGSPAYLLQTNLQGTLNCLEFTRKKVGHLVFLSSSRIYAIDPLRAIPLIDNGNRLIFDDSKASMKGVSKQGISEDFAVDTHRSLYGATKLCSEYFIQEYVATFGIKAVINRCGVLAGPGQFGKVDQGFVTLWVARHLFGGGLTYRGFDGQGKQVRDILHPEDLGECIRVQVGGKRDLCSRAEVYNLGGGLQGSVSLKDATKLCQEATGRAIKIESIPETSSVDIPWYVTDYKKAKDVLGWQPKRMPKDVIEEITQWLRQGEAELKPIFMS